MSIWRQQFYKLKFWLARDPILFGAMGSAIVSMFVVPPSKAYWDYFNFSVLGLLWAFMLVVAGLQKAGVFRFLVNRLLLITHHTRMLGAVLIGVCFFTSMIITNDVALLTFVPLAIFTLRHVKKSKLLIPVIVLQTVAANLGSMLTPLGNPQNLYLYTLSQMSAGQFMKIMLIPFLFSFGLLVIALFFIKQEEIVITSIENNQQSISWKQVFPWCLLFFLCLLAVSRILPYFLVLIIVLIIVVFLDKALLRHADYSLLFTFIFFFILIGNLKSLAVIRETMGQILIGRELPLGILLSQVISNVPAAVLLSGFTEDYAPLLIGVNLGGLGTLIASMASIISYKLYIQTEDAKPGKYLANFTVVNILFLGILWGLSRFYY